MKFFSQVNGFEFMALVIYRNTLYWTFLQFYKMAI
jgi:hypothetical protein